MGLLDDEKKLFNPVIFHEGPFKGFKPVSNIESEIDGEDRYAISSLTDNGKYLVNGFLYYKFNGVEIYTDKNNIIFVDEINKRLFIREYNKVSAGINPSNPETKQYIILYSDIGGDDSDNEFPYRWEACQGRLNAYEYIKANAAIIDIDKSIIVVEDVPIKDCLTVRQFVKHLKNSNMVDEYDGFEIDDYYGSDEY